MTKSLHPKISVIIPTKNRADYVAKAIKSVLNQTFQDFEILIIDGGSTNATKEILRNFVDARILYFSQKDKKGVSAARNLGINQSRGQFISFLDDDDVWMPRKLEKQIALLRQNKSFSVVYGLSSYVIQSDGRVIGLYNRPNFIGGIYPRILEENIIGNCSSILIRKECFEMELFDVDLPAAEDWDLWIRLAKKFCFKPIDEPLDAYRLHGERLTRSYYGVLHAAKTMFKKYSEDIYSSPNCHEALRRWHLLLGLAYLQSGDKTHARAEYVSAISMNPRSVQCYIRYLLCFIGPEPYNSIQVFLERKMIGRTLRKK